MNDIVLYSKTCLKQPLKQKTKNWFPSPIIAEWRSKVLQNAPRGAFCNTFDLTGENFAILLTCIKLPFAIMTFVLSTFEWPLTTRYSNYFASAFKQPLTPTHFAIFIKHIFGTNCISQQRMLRRVSACA